MDRIVSGVQPTGNLHLGNYLGAIRQFVGYQDTFDCYYCVVDLHAITVQQDPAAFAQHTREIAAAYLAAGVDPKKATIFVQSAVTAHNELAWMLACMTPLGWLNRMTQFKEKAGKKKDQAVLGLYSYPVLMAADILLYHATRVPVGEDQQQHLELSRDIATTFNHRYKTEYFPVPQAQVVKSTARIMSLRDGAKKMSKSDESEFSRVNLTDDADTIAAKVRKAKTDSDPMPDTVEGLDGRAEAKNLLGIYCAVTGEDLESVLTRTAGQMFSAFKPVLAEALVAHLEPLGAEMRRYLDDPTELDRILHAGGQRANEIASKTLAETREIMGFWG